MARKKKTEEQAAPVVEEPKKAPDPKVRTFRTELDVILTDEEIKQRGIQVAYLYRDIGRAEEDLKELVKEKKADIAKIVMKLQGFADEVREGKRRSDVLCEETTHYDLLRVVQVRMDTGEEILNRPFSDEEARTARQGILQFEKDKEKPAPADVADFSHVDDTEEDGIVVGEPEFPDGVVDDNYPPRDGSEERDFPENEPDDEDEDETDDDEE